MSGDIGFLLLTKVSCTAPDRGPHTFVFSPSVFNFFIVKA